MVIVIHVEIFEGNIVFPVQVIEAWVDVALHLMKQVKVIHQLMENIASTTLQNIKPTINTPTYKHTNTYRENTSLVCSLLSKLCNTSVPRPKCPYTTALN